MERTKYPRTMNLPWSQSNSSDDVWWSDTTAFDGREVVMTEKLDGECTTVYPDGHTHARSIDSKHHPSRSWMKSFAATFAYRIPQNFRICGENVYAYHSIFYDQLPSYFFVYGIYNDNLCLPWDKVEAICEDLGLQTVPVLWRGVWDEKTVRERWVEGLECNGTFPTFALAEDSHEVPVPEFPRDFLPCEAEGYVVRATEGFLYEQFRTHCAKYVRANHVQTSQNWMTAPMVPNKLAD